MDAQEFAEWQAYYRIQPFGDDWAQTDAILWMLYQVNRSRNSENLTMGTFLPKGFGLGITEKHEPAKTGEDIARKLNAWAKMHGLKQVEVKNG
jgi:hypothetical protein